MKPVIFLSDYQIVDTKCQPEISKDQGHQIFSQLKSHPETRYHLTFWMSTIKTLQSLINPHVEDATKTIEAIEMELDRGKTS